MLKLIILAGAVMAVVWLLKRAFAADRPADSPPHMPPHTPQGDLVACARCGVNLPRSEARLAGDRIYCSDEHLRLGPRQR